MDSQLKREDMLWHENVKLKRELQILEIAHTSSITYNIRLEAEIKDYREALEKIAKDYSGKMRIWAREVLEKHSTNTAPLKNEK